jgi:hypothetical protein
MRVQNTPQETRQNRGMLKRVRRSWARAEARIANDGNHYFQFISF